jgi:signal transduction histidine kinase
MPVRFDDMLATVLAQPAESPQARLTVWRQLVDLAAQRRGGDAALLAAAAERLRMLRSEVPEPVRAEVARAIAGRPLPQAIVALFGEERPAIAAPLLRSAQLTSDEWCALLPALPMTSRALLRLRHDLPAEVTRALASFGPADFALSGAVSEVVAREAQAEAIDGGVQIRELMARIEAFRRRRGAGVPVREQAAVPATMPAFRFETGTDGVIAWLSGVAREALIGETIAVPGEGAHGVDGHAAGAFRRRAPFRDARLSVAGEGSTAGEWRISAVPFFDALDGRFMGYRGTGRRPRADEQAALLGSGLFGSGMAADSLRQLVHELRTPINAISGFGEMIEQQMLGPIPASYRAHASEIVSQAQRLLGAIDDLDIAARIETQRLHLAHEPVDVAIVLAAAAADHAPLAVERGAEIALEIAPDAPPAAGDAGAIARMCARLVAATVGLAAHGETIALGLIEAPGQLCVSVSRPAALAGQDERSLLDPGYGPAGESPDAPALGLGFSLRLVRNLAAAADGALEIEPTRFMLSLPADGDAARAKGRG